MFPPGRKKGHSHFHLTREPWSQDHAKACSPGKKVGGKICGGLSHSRCWMESCIQETWDDCSKLNFWQKWGLSKLVSMPVIQPSESSCLFRVGGLTTQDILCSSFRRSEAFWYFLIICQLCDKKLKCLRNGSFLWISQSFVSPEISLWH